MDYLICSDNWAACVAQNSVLARSAENCDHATVIWDTASKLLLALLPLAIAGIQYWPRGGRRSRIKADLELYKLLPEDLPHRDAFRESIGLQVQRLIEHETVKRRHASTVVTGLIFLALGVYPIVLAFHGGWWLTLFPVGAAASFVGIATITDGLTKGERDERGRLVKKRRKRSTDDNPGEAQPSPATMSASLPAPEQSYMSTTTNS